MVVSASTKVAMVTVILVYHMYTYIYIYLSIRVLYITILCDYHISYTYRICFLNKYSQTWLVNRVYIILFGICILLEKCKGEILHVPVSFGTKKQCHGPAQPFCKGSLIKSIHPEKVRFWTKKIGGLEDVFSTFPFGAFFRFHPLVVVGAGCQSPEWWYFQASFESSFSSTLASWSSHTVGFMNNRYQMFKTVPRIFHLLLLWDPSTLLNFLC